MMEINGNYISSFNGGAVVFSFTLTAEETRSSAQHYIDIKHNCY